MKRILLLVCGVVLAMALWGQGVKMTVGQLKGFLLSSIQIKHTDKQID